MIFPSLTPPLLLQPLQISKGEKKKANSLQARNTIPGQEETREDSRMERLRPGITYLESCLRIEKALIADGKAHFLRKQLLFSV